MTQTELLESGTTVDTLEWLRENGQVRVEEHGGARYVVGNGEAVRLPDDDPLPTTVRFESLGALLRYAERLYLDTVGPAGLQLDVTRHNRVNLCGGRNLHSGVPLFASAVVDRPGLSEEWNSPLNLAYLIGRHVAEGGDRDSLIKILSDVRMEDASIQRIEGLAVKVTAERKLSGKGFHEVTSPYFDLRPRRTFAEVEQPMSPYLFEAREQGGSPSIRLTCADGGDWQLDAVNNVGKWLETEAEARKLGIAVIY